MSFSAATCITFNPGTQTGTDLFDVYLNEDYTPPIFSSVTVSQLTTNCPFIFDNIPNGTDNLWLKDEVNNICITIPIQNNDICSNCNLGLSQYSSSTITKLYCGYLTGSCQYDDYLINWYGPNDTTTLSFQSGAGSFVTSGVYSHPFSTSLTSIPCESGIYTPVISKIKISGITFSNTGGTDNVLFSGSCLPSTNILPLTCDVKTNTDTSWDFSAFTNFINFNASVSSPQPVQTTYQISANTKYIVWAFKGFDFSDRILLEFSGSSYGTTKIGIDDFIIGYDVPSTNFTPSLYPKSGNTPQNFVKFSCLTGLTVTNGDKIIITVTPLSTDTNWSLYMSCLDDYNCNDCLNTSQPYKIISSTITSTLQTCNKIKINFSLSGCNIYDQNSDFLVYNLGNTLNRAAYYSNSNTTNNYITPPDPELYFSSNKCINTQKSVSTSCTWDLTSATTYNKTFLTDGSNRGVFGFTGSSTFISTYYNSIQNAFSGLSPYDSDWTGSTINTDLSYYRYYILKIPSQSVGISSCQDNNTFNNTYLHHTSPYITGTTGDYYYLNITANTISKNINYTNCDLDCNNIQGNINLINNTSTGTTYTDRTFNFPWGMYYTNPVYQVTYVTSASTSSNPTSIRQGYFVTPDWNFNTYPFSGNPSTIIPSYSGSVCNYNNTGVKSSQYSSFNITQYKFYYEVRLTNPSNVSDFDIWASPITNLSYSGAPGTVLYELAYRYSGGSVIYSASTYFI